MVLSACDNGKADGEEDDQVQGRIIYEISYPYYDSESIMAGFLPKEMIMTFKGSKTKIDVHVKSLFSNILIADEDDRSIKMLVQLSNQKYEANLNEEQIDRYLSGFPEATYLETTQKDSLAGYDCDVTTAVLASISREVNLYHTQEIGLNQPNWCNPYKAIPGVLLQYQVTMYGLTMNFKATEVIMEDISDDEFSTPKDYDETSFDKIERELIRIFNSIQDEEPA